MTQEQKISGPFSNHFLEKGSEAKAIEFLKEISEEIPLEKLYKVIKSSKSN